MSTSQRTNLCRPCGMLVTLLEAAGTSRCECRSHPSWEIHPTPGRQEQQAGAAFLRAKWEERLPRAEVARGSLLKGLILASCSAGGRKGHGFSRGRGICKCVEVRRHL